MRRLAVLLQPAAWAELIARLPRPAARWSRLFGLGAVVGIAGGLAAAGLEFLLHHGVGRLVGTFADPAGSSFFRFNPSLLVLPTIGGLISGVVMRLVAGTPSAQGTEALTHAFHHDFGRLHLREPGARALTAVGVISCGGSTGPEGPVAALGASIGSSIASLFRLTPHERRIMLLAGCAAGVGAIFQCPLGGALFATGVLYSEPEFESDAMVPCFVASVIGFTTFMLFFGHSGPHLLRGASALSFSSAWELIPYAVLGPLCGLVSIFFSLCLGWVRDGLIPRVPGPRWLMPAVGGLGTGVLAMALPQVMDARYAFINNAMGFRPGVEGLESATWWTLAALFAAVVVARCLATALTVGAGASGGVLGPSVFIGGATGALVGALGMAIAPGTFDDSLRQAMIPVGMAGVLAASMRTPLAAMVMVTEMTGSYGLIVPLMLVCVSAYVTGRRWGLNHEQVRSASESPAHAGDVMVHLLESIPVAEVMDQRWADTATPDETLGSLVRRMKPGTRPVFAVTEGERLLGLVSTADIHRIMNEPALADVVIAADLMREPSQAVRPEEDLYQALNVFSRAGEDALPVVSSDASRRWLGMLTREGVFETVRRHIAELQGLMLREHTGLSAIGREGELQHIVMGVAPARQNLVQRLLVPLQAVGQSLREADFRRQFGAQVIAIEEPDGTILCPPPLDSPLRTGQRLLAIVTQESLPPRDDDQPE